MSASSRPPARRRAWLRSVAVAGVAVACGVAATLPAGAEPPATRLAPATGSPAPRAPHGTPTPDGRVIVRLAPGTPAADAARLASAAAGGGTAQVLAGGRLAVVTPRRGVSRDDTLHRLAADPRVEGASPDEVIHVALTPNDTQYSSQWGLKATGSGSSAETAWGITTGSRNVVVGMLDTGIDLSHPDLAANLWDNRLGIGGCAYGTHGYDFVNGDCTPSDDDGHGTHTAGTVGAVGDNGVGVAGVNWRVSLMGLKMLDATGQGTVSGALSAMDWAITAKHAGVNVRVLNASWGALLSTDAQTAIDAELQALRTNGILFVAAAGNNGAGTPGVPGWDDDESGQHIYPCTSTLDNVICVAAIDSLGELPWFSNWGATSVDLAAPGAAVLSTYPGGYAYADGTSMATPHVTGAAALTAAALPSLTMSQLRARILVAVDSAPALAGKVATGGYLDVCKAIPGCGSTPAAPPSPPTSLALRERHQKIALQWAPPVSPNASGGITGYRVTASTGYDSGPLAASARSVTIGGLTDNANVTVQVTATSAGGTSTAATARARPTNGGFEIDGYGGLHPISVGSGPAPTAASGTPYWPGTDLARSVALMPDGTGGYVLDAFGGLHPFSVGGNPAPPAASGGPYWPGFAIARGVALLPDGTGGYVLDGWGGLHPFGVGDHARPPASSNGPYWSGWDITRGVTFGSATGGWVVDGWGGVHPFAVGGGPAPAKPQTGPYWFGWDIARGIAALPGTTGGYVLDGYGGLHVFAQPVCPPNGPGPCPAGVGVSPYWLGWDIARGVSA